MGDTAIAGGEREECRKYQYSVLRYTSKASMYDEEVNIGIILADRDAGIVYRHLITKDDIAKRDAEGLLPCPVIGFLDAAACGDRDGSGNPEAALNRLHAEYGHDKDAMRITMPRYLHIPTHDHNGAAQWMYEATLTRNRKVSEEQTKASMSGVRHPDTGEYQFVSIQYVPDALRDEPVNVGLAVSDKSTGRVIVRYVEGADREMLGQERFGGWIVQPYERVSSVHDIDDFMLNIAKPDISCVQCTPPRTASGRGAEAVLDELYTRLVSPAPHHDGGRLMPRPMRRGAS